MDGKLTLSRLWEMTRIKNLFNLNLSLVKLLMMITTMILKIATIVILAAQLLEAHAKVQSSVATNNNTKLVQASSRLTSLQQDSISKKTSSIPYKRFWTTVLLKMVVITLTEMLFKCWKREESSKDLKAEKVPNPHLFNKLCWIE